MSQLTENENVIKNIGEFTGSQGQDIYLHFRRIEIRKTMYSWDASKTFEIAKLTLNGTALNHVISLAPTSYTALKNCLIGKFGISKNTGVIYANLFSVNQGNKSVRDFINLLDDARVRIVHNSGTSTIDDGVMFAALLNGLKPKIKEYLVVMDINDYNKACSKAIELEDLYSSDADKNNDNSNPSGTSALLPVKSKSENTSGKACHNCASTDHLVRNCPLKNQNKTSSANSFQQTYVPQNNFRFNGPHRTYQPRMQYTNYNPPRFHAQVRNFQQFNRTICYKCQKPGHIAKHCRSRAHYSPADLQAQAMFAAFRNFGPFANSNGNIQNPTPANPFMHPAPNYNQPALPPCQPPTTYPMPNNSKNM